MFVRRLPLLIGLIFLTAPGQLSGQEPKIVLVQPGDHIRVQAPKLYNTPIIGNVEAITPDTLMLAVTSGRTIGVPLAYISKLEKSVESAGLGVKGALLGGLAGAALGAWFARSEGGPTSAGMFLGAFGGFVVGGLIAGPSEEWVEVSLEQAPLARPLPLESVCGCECVSAA